MAKITRIMVAPLAVNCYIIATEQHNAVAIDAGGSVPGGGEEQDPLG